jgi:hypothetical protein
MGAVGEFVTSTGRPFDRGEPYVTYCFVPGALLDAYCFARLNPDHRVALIIEELSRANASLVFGDMLQLLDRSDDAAKAGWSPYGLRPKPEVRDYYLIENGVDVGSDGEMKFPPNLFIWETMNRSDQNARQLDAAFLRRWEKRYLSHRTKSDHGDLLDPTPVGDIRWDVLRSLINDALLKLRIPEDKLVGPYFSKKGVPVLKEARRGRPARLPLERRPPNAGARVLRALAPFPGRRN